MVCILSILRLFLVTTKVKSLETLVAVIKANSQEILRLFFCVDNSFTSLDTGLKKVKKTDFKNVLTGRNN